MSVEEAHAFERVQLVGGLTGARIGEVAVQLDKLGTEEAAGRSGVALKAL